MFLGVGLKFRVTNGLRGSKLDTFTSYKCQELYMLEKNLVTGDLLVRQSLEKPAKYECFLHLIKSGRMPSLSKSALNQIKVRYRQLLCFQSRLSIDYMSQSNLGNVVVTFGAFLVAQGMTVERKPNQIPLCVAFLDPQIETVQWLVCSFAHIS